jgi:hypothetical protein
MFGKTKSIFGEMQKIVDDKNNIYKLVPAQGGILGDGTWWANSSATAGQVCTVHYYYRKVIAGKWWASDKSSLCIGTASYGGKTFARWEPLPETEFKPCVQSINKSLCYEYLLEDKN